MSTCKLAYVCAFLMVGATGSFAQNISSSVLGIVVDPAGSVVPTAEIKLVNQGTAAVNAAVTDNAGFFRITNIFAGHLYGERAIEGFQSPDRQQ